MDLRIKQIPQTPADWERLFRGIFVEPSNDTVGTNQLKVAAVTTAKIADRAVTPAKSSLADTDGKFLVRRGDAMAYSVLFEPDIPVDLARTTAVTSAIGDAIAAHVAEADPHTQYLTEAEGDARYGVLADLLEVAGAYDPPNLINGARDTATVTVTGAALGDYARASYSLDLQGITLFAWVSATDTVKALFFNQTGGTIDLGPGTLRVKVEKA